MPCFFCTDIYYCGMLTPCMYEKQNILKNVRSIFYAFGGHARNVMRTAFIKVVKVFQSNLKKIEPGCSEAFLGP